LPFEIDRWTASGLPPGTVSLALDERFANSSLWDRQTTAATGSQLAADLCPETRLQRYGRTAVGNSHGLPHCYESGLWPESANRQSRGRRTGLLALHTAG